MHLPCDRLPSHPGCTPNILRIHLSPDQNKPVIEDEWMIVLDYTAKKALDIIVVFQNEALIGYCALILTATNKIKPTINKKAQ